jgi:hypothetical protein
LRWLETLSLVITQRRIRRLQRRTGHRFFVFRSESITQMRLDEVDDWPPFLIARHEMEFVVDLGRKSVSSIYAC